MDSYAVMSDPYANYIGFSNLPPETSGGDFWANIISTIAGAGVAAYQISKGVPTATTTQLGTTTVQTGQAAYSQTNMMLILAAVVIIALLMFRK